MTAVQVNDADLCFWVNPGDAPIYYVDLSEFANGGRKTELRNAIQWVWGGDFAGRPRFARQIATYFRLASPGPRHGVSVRSALRYLFRFLDITDPVVLRVEDLTTAHGNQFMAWLQAGGSHSTTYRTVKSVVERIRQIEGLGHLWWPARPADVGAVQEDVDLLGMRRLFNALKSEGREIKAMFREGENLAATGRDPRGESICRGMTRSYWAQRENHAWLIHHLTKSILPDKRGFDEERGLGLTKANTDAQYHLGPAYIAPGMTDRGRQGIVGKLRWFHPSYHDTAVFLWLFLLGTGWNLATALSIDVSSDEKWFDDHPHKPEFKVLLSYKGRARKHVFALSLNKPEWHPFQIVRFIIDRTRVLRETIRRRLVVLGRRLITA